MTEISNIEPYTEKQLQHCLQDALGWILPKQRDLSVIARQLAGCTRVEQASILEWMHILIPQHIEITYQFLKHAHLACQHLPMEGLEAWLKEALQKFEMYGLRVAVTHLQSVMTYAETYCKYHQGVRLSDKQRILETFLIGLNGKSLTIASHEFAYTDTQTLYLPPALQRFTTNAENFSLYKLMLVHLWAQNTQGTWTIPHLHSQTAWELFHVLERIRLDFYIAQQYPKLAEERQRLLARAEERLIPLGWEKIAAQLVHATVQDSLRLLEQIETWEIPSPVCYQGVLRPDAVQRVACMPQTQSQATQPAQETIQEISSQLSEEIVLKIQTRTSKTLKLEGQTLFPDEAQQHLASITQHQGTLPETYFLGVRGHSVADNITVVEKLTYPEWDYRRKRYHQSHCFLQEIEIVPVADDFIEQTLKTYHGLLKTLRRTFEMLRGGNYWLKRQTDGEEIDMDALIAAQADTLRGEELSAEIFTRWQRAQRDVAVMLMVDMSGSTQGWINLAERESLVLFSEVLEILGDRYAIYGFSGTTRKQCEIYPVKRFDEPYNLQVKQRISGIQPRSYTRMGVAIRHLTKLLCATDARIKLLITLSDGKPDDEGDDYRGYYGIEDTRQALLEARHQDIHPFCITIDQYAKTYLPHLYGKVNYTVIERVSQLPFKLADIYRQLTT